MATWTTTAQLTTGTLVVGASDRVWFNGTNFGDNVTVGSYQSSTHISNASDVHSCTTNHVHNVKYVDGTHGVLDAGASALLSTLTTANAPIKLNFADAASVATSAASFYFYDGTTDATAMAGVSAYAVEITGSQTTWSACNGSGAAMNIANQAAATSHDFFVAASLAPTATGSKTGKYKIQLTYV